MKRLKIIYTTLALLIVVSGALAFKANRMNTRLYLHDVNDTRPLACTKLSQAVTTSINQVFITRTLASTTTTKADCPIVDVYAGQ